MSDSWRILKIFHRIADNIFSPIILRSTDPRRDNSCVVMLRQFLIGLDKYRLILVALLPVRRCWGIIRNQNRRYTTEKLIHVDMCCDPSAFLLVDESFYEGVLTVGL